MNLNVNSRELFKTRHNGPNETEIAEMLKTVGVKDLNELINKTVPKNIRNSGTLDLQPAQTEFEFLK